LPVRIIRENVRFARNAVPCQIIGTLPSYTEIVGLDIVKDNMGWSGWEKFRNLTPNDKTNLQEPE
jgi:hypothetical protein